MSECVLRTLFVVVCVSALLSGKCKVLTFLRVWTFYSHALYILSADDSGRFLQNPREVTQIVRGQNEQSMRVKRSDPQED